MRIHQSFLIKRGWLVFLSLFFVFAIFSLIRVEASLEEQEAAASTPRVFFVSPQDGDTFEAFEFGLNEIPVTFEFGIENYELSAIPSEYYEQPRSQVGHHHLGVNTECLSPGELIPAGAPWIHFGDASTTIDMMLEDPGEHTFVLQLGNDEHRTQPGPGLCESITITID
jgi:hypothetical protein